MLRITRTKYQFKAIDKMISHPNSMLSYHVGSGASRYRRMIIFICVPGFFICLNGGIWQLFRRREKMQHLTDCANLHKEPMKVLPTAENPAVHMQPIVLDGTFDNEGSVLVGPRPQPNTSVRAKGDNTAGGFFIMTPFEVAHTKQVIMVNRGWVPLDAAKSRLHMVQYIGEGFKKHRLRGIIRRQEVLTTKMGKEVPENFGPRPGGMAWDVFRPHDMALSYYRRRFGIADMAERQAVHGTQNFFVEMIEDNSGDDQVFIKEFVYPFRKDDAELRFQKLAAGSHMAYALFWLSLACFFGSLIVGMKSATNAKVAASKFSKAMDENSMKSMSISKAAYVQSDLYKQSLAEAGGKHRVKAGQKGAAPPDTNLGNDRFI